MRYPINFVVKHPNLSTLSRKARPQAVETRSPGKKPDEPASRSESLTYEVAMIGKQQMRIMVELNGIEPLTPCLQSRCSPS
jgi:hypothetical protein